MKQCKIGSCDRIFGGGAMDMYNIIMLSPEKALYYNFREVERPLVLLNSNEFKSIEKSLIRRV